MALGAVIRVRKLSCNATTDSPTRMLNAGKTKIKVQIGVTVVLGLFSLYLIATEPANSDKTKWAFGIIGIIIGYWLK